MPLFVPPEVKPVKLVGTYTSNASGVWSGTINPALRYWVQPMTAGEFANSLAIAGNQLTVSFRKFKAGGLGITLGTLLTVTAFEDTPGQVSFNLFGAEEFTGP
jgi:hypothetical protein